MVERLGYFLRNNISTKQLLHLSLVQRPLQKRGGGCGLLELEDQGGFCEIVSPRNVRVHKVSPK